ncbi:MAG: glycosyltransferase family 2 protein [Myxococcales bacterium]|nr:glycosyltransferase family 2 protein [Myxococcales bacterium]
MKCSVRLSILIPAYQEQATIAEVLRRVAAVPTEAHGFDKEIVVCDDGSTDDTLAIVDAVAREVPCITVVKHDRNRGKGASIRTCLRAATGDYCLVQDADLEYDVTDYPSILSALAQGADVVYGSRFLRRRIPQGMQLPNWICNHILTTTSNLLFGTHITDEATCFKAFRTPLLRDLKLECDSFDFCPEVTAKVGARGIAIVEVPIGYHARTHAEGKKIHWVHGFQALWALLKYRAITWSEQATPRLQPSSDAEVMNDPR